LRVAFAGTPPFAATAMEAIVGAGHSVPLVLTQPDRPAGRRGLKLTPSAVAGTAQKLGLHVLKPTTLRDAQAQAALREANADVMVVAAYGLLLPADVLEIPRLGCINIHASLLPRWRGAAPIQRALLAGDERTGITIMKMDVGLDTGPILLVQPLEIQPDDTAGTLTNLLAQIGARLVVEALGSLDQLNPRPQDALLATHAPKITKADSVIDWTLPALAIERRVRALNPVPGAEARYAAEGIKIWRAQVVEGVGLPAQVLSSDSQGVVVACGTGALLIKEVQRPGGKAMPAAEFARGARLAPDMFFGADRRTEPTLLAKPLN
jgi:methionyl-tRNA formyltransferase